MPTDGRQRIAILDEYDYNRAMLESSLRTRKYDIVCSTFDPEKIFGVLQSGAADVLVTDILLSRTDGMEFVRLACSCIKNGSPKIIVCSQIREERIINRIIQYGASYYMLKPVNPDILADRIDLLTENSRPSQSAPSEPAKPESKSVNPDTYDDELERRITKVIADLAIPPHIKGYSFIRYAVLVSFREPEAAKSITKIIYPTVAKKFATTPSRVERAIRHAIQVSWERNCALSDDKQRSSLYSHVLPVISEKPTNSEFIASVSELLRLGDTVMSL